MFYVNVKDRSDLLILAYFILSNAVSGIFVRHSDKFRTISLIVIFCNMNIDSAIFSAITFISILLGGYISFKFKDRLHFVMAFAAGVLLGIVAFEILPEIFEMAHEYEFDASHAMIALA